MLLCKIYNLSFNLNLTFLYTNITMNDLHGTMLAFKDMWLSYQQKQDKSVETKMVETIELKEMDLKNISKCFRTGRKEQEWELK
jgi:hypothetical protein